MTIHIIGTGAIGCQFGAALRANKHRVNLLLRSQGHLDDFKSRNNSVTYRHEDRTEIISGFDASLIDSKDQEPIYSLIVATKAHYTAQALEPIVSRLTPESSILLLQNGMGIADELIRTIWPDSTPPKFYMGVNRHVVERIAPYDIIHHTGYNDPNALKFARFSHSDSQSSEHSSDEIPELVQTIVGTSALNATLVPWKDFLFSAYKKLIVNCCINGPGSMLSINNGTLLKKENLNNRAVVRSICEETYAVLKDDLPGEDVESLMEMVTDIAFASADDISSTQQDIKAKRATEINFLNGYICARGQKAKIDTKVNQTIVDFIHAIEDKYLK